MVRFISIFVLLLLTGPLLAYRYIKIKDNKERQRRKTRLEVPQIQLIGSEANDQQDKHQLNYCSCFSIHNGMEAPLDSGKVLQHPETQGANSNATGARVTRPCSSFDAIPSKFCCHMAAIICFAGIPCQRETILAVF